MTERALLLLQAANQDLEIEDLANFSIAMRDGLLLSMRKSTFGSQIEALANCPNCKERMEIEFCIDDLLRFFNDSHERAEHAALNFNGYEVRFRLPNSNDLLAVEKECDVERAKATLLNRCVLSARIKHQDVPPDHLPKAVVNRIEEEMFKMDPNLEIEVELNCPACGNNGVSSFDILSFFWNELGALAQRLLFEVHTLASAYGWSEAKILAMSATRRNAYLEMITA